MPYKFTFDLSRISRFLFREVAKISYQKEVHKKMGKNVLSMIDKFKIREATGLDLSEAVLVLEDLIDIQARNLIDRERFTKTTKRALLLPHCSRKYMDNRCKAAFLPELPSYSCAHCSSDCLVNKATTFAEKKGYDVYVLPGGSCVPKILKARGYDGIVGVACGEEIKLSGEVMNGTSIPAQAVPLIKNGCANTIFNTESLFNVLS